MSHENPAEITRNYQVEYTPKTRIASYISLCRIHERAGQCNVSRSLEPFTET